MEVSINRDGIETGLLVWLAICKVILGFRRTTKRTTVFVIGLSESDVSLSTFAHAVMVT
jgi:hypothetical protein